MDGRAAKSASASQRVIRIASIPRRAGGLVRTSDHRAPAPPSGSIAPTAAELSVSGGLPFGRGIGGYLHAAHLIGEPTVGSVDLDRGGLDRREPLLPPGYRRGRVTNR